MDNLCRASGACGRHNQQQANTYVDATEDRAHLAVEAKVKQTKGALERARESAQGAGTKADPFAKGEATFTFFRGRDTEK
mmetsp:Transcript_37280/g.84187  ORF Transcript_37280/g.84187 Transcript_37280/m.84187 type:complete len:80 (+) Transcript_37280:536-775(+)